MLRILAVGLVGGVGFLTDWAALSATGEWHDVLMKAAVAVVAMYVTWVTVTLRRGEKHDTRVLILLEGQKDRGGHVLQEGLVDRFARMEKKLSLVRGDATNAVTAPLIDIQLRMDRVDQQVTAIGQRVDDVYTTFGRKTP